MSYLSSQGFGFYVTANFFDGDVDDTNALTRNVVSFSKNMKNVNTTKVEAGFDIKLPGSRKLSVIAYQDRTANGFQSFTEYVTFPVKYFDENHGLNITPGQSTTVDDGNPASVQTMWTTKGTIGNTAVNINKGVEFDFDLGKLNPINTSIYLSGAWQESKSYSKSRHYGNPTPMPTSYFDYSTTPFKMVWPAEQETNRYRQFLSTLRLVTNIPQLRMVASFTGQVIWHNSTLSYAAAKAPIGWIDTDLNYHELTTDMMNGYLGADAGYYATAPAGIEYVKVAEQEKEASHGTCLLV